MRCPKCGYISFDRVERCSKCAHDLMAVAAQLRGPMARVAAPMFLGGLGRAGGLGASPVAEVEPVTFDLDEEALDLGEMGVEAETLTLEEEPAGEQAEGEIGIEMPSLSGIDVSDLMPPQEEAAPAELPEEEISGIAMPETLAAEAAIPPAEPEKDDTLSSLTFDLTGGESRGEAERDADQEPAGGEVLDLTELLGAGAEEPGEDSSDPFTLSLGSSDTGGGFDLTLDDDTEPAAAPEASTPEQHDIPDLGLSLESDEEDETPKP